MCGTIMPRTKETKMPVTAPVRDLKNTAQFTEKVLTEKEVLVTKNGIEVMTCISPARRKAELEELAKAKLLSRILLAEDEIEHKNYVDFDEFNNTLKEAYGL